MSRDEIKEIIKETMEELKNENIIPQVCLLKCPIENEKEYYEERKFIRWMMSMYEDTGKSIRDIVVKAIITFIMGAIAIGIAMSIIKIGYK